MVSEVLLNNIQYVKVMLKLFITLFCIDIKNYICISESKFIEISKCKNKPTK